ncbi:MAG: hypothetical protein ACJ8AU_00970 [Gemmatimonadales bacterium]
MHPAIVSLASGGLIFRALRGVGAASSDEVRPARSILLLVLLTWVPLVVLAALEGTLTGSAVEVPLLRDPAVHARLLVALPLLIVADVVVSRAAQSILQLIRQRRLVDDAELPALEAALDRLVRDRDSLAIELLIMALVVTVLWLGRNTLLADRLAAHSSWLGTAGAEPVLSRAGWWYFVVSLFISSVLALRWAWWLFIWSRFVVGFLRPRLVVSPGHPDQHGGLSFLTLAQGAFAPVFAALAATVAGRLAYEMLHDGAPLAAAKGPAVVVLVVAMLAMYAPLLFFIGRMGPIKRRALMGYDALGQQLVGNFERKWLSAERTSEPLLGNADPSTLADFTSSYASVRLMKPMPLDIRRMIPALLVVMLPLLPLALMVMSLADVLKRMMKLLV